MIRWNLIGYQGTREKTFSRVVDFWSLVEFLFAIVIVSTPTNKCNKIMYMRHRLLSFYNWLFVKSENRELGK